MNDAIEPRGKAAQRLGFPTVMITATLLLSACAGGVGGNPDGGTELEGEEFAYGASQKEVNAAVEGLEPVTLTYQPSGASQNSIMAPAALKYKEIVEERSNGKITLDLVWGQAIAGYGEVHDALADGRVDLADTLPVYQPAEFPAVNDLGTIMAGLPSSPYLGELVANAVGNEMSWNNENILAQYEEIGITPLTPFKALSGYYSLCADSISDLDTWNGLQVRIASSAQGDQVQQLGGSPVSMEYGETFEALQRGTVDCTLAPLITSAESGVLEVAPNIGYSTTHSFSRSSGAFLAGSSFQNLPKAYQQILFDANMRAQSVSIFGIIKGNAVAIQQGKEAGGEVKAFPEAIQSEIGAYSEVLTSEAVANGLVDEAAPEKIDEAAGKWTQVLESLGYQDGGETADMDEWLDMDGDGSELNEYATALYEQGPAMDHRPE